MRPPGVGSVGVTRMRTMVPAGAAMSPVLSAFCVVSPVYVGKRYSRSMRLAYGRSATDKRNVRERRPLVSTRYCVGTPMSSTRAVKLSELSPVIGMCVHCAVSLVRIQSSAPSAEKPMARAVTRTLPPLAMVASPGLMSMRNGLTASALSHGTKSARSPWRRRSALSVSTVTRTTTAPAMVITARSMPLASTRRPSSMACVRSRAMRRTSAPMDPGPTCSPGRLDTSTADTSAPSSDGSCSST